jgi:hypothetical protein
MEGGMHAPRVTKHGIPEQRENIDSAYFLDRRKSDSFSLSATCVSILSRLVIKYTTASGIVITKMLRTSSMIPLPCHSYRVTLSMFIILWVLLGCLVPPNAVDR